MSRSNSRRYLSKMFLNLGKPQPKSTDLVCKSHKLMMYNDIIAQEHSGAFHFLPFGLRALEKLTNVIDEEMQAIGCEKIAMPILTAGNLWKTTDRWNTMGPELFRLKDRHNMDYCLGPTHEEAITDLVSSQAPISYRRLPILLYQITRKFRDEMAPKYGLLRGREFDMKDLYTFDESEAKAKETYEKVCEAYNNIFDRLQIEYVKVAGDTGAIGGSMSHEYHLPSDIGQDRLMICADCKTGSNRELIDTDNLHLHKCDRPNCGPNFQESPGIEVGHAFFLGTKYSEPFKATFLSECGKPELLEMGCYGLGVSRILQASVEVLSLENQIRWPNLIAPYQISIIPQKEGYQADTCLELAESLSDRLTSNRALTREVVIDDRTHMTIGKRVYEAKRIGFPYVIAVGKKALETPPLYELMNIWTEETVFLTEDQICDKLSTLETVR